MGVFHNSDGVNTIHKKKKEWEKFGQGKKRGVSLKLPTQKNVFILTEKFNETFMVILQ